MAVIDYYLSLLSPFTYLAGTRLEGIAERHGAQVVYRPVDIHAVLAATGGLPVAERHPARQDYRLQELRRGAAKAGLALNPRPAFWPTDDLPAACAVIAVAEKGGRAGVLAHSLLTAVWAEDFDIADPKVIDGKLAAVGEDMKALTPAMAAAERTYRANTEAAVAVGAFGVPFYVVGSEEEKFWGHDRLDDLDAYLATRPAE